MNSYVVIVNHYNLGAFETVILDLSGTLVMQVRTLFPSNNISHDAQEPNHAYQSYLISTYEYN